LQTSTLGCIPTPSLVACSLSAPSLRPLPATNVLCPQQLAGPQGRCWSRVTLVMCQHNSSGDR